MKSKRSFWYQQQRERMVAAQLEGRGIRDMRVLAAMRKVPRHLFVPLAYRLSAYEDRPLPLGPEQTISQPYVVAYMLECLELNGQDEVLEIGTGSGYETAVLAELTALVCSMEIDERLNRRAGRCLKALGFENVCLRLGNGYEGWPEKDTSFSKIILSAACSSIPRALLAQLKVGGKMILPFGDFDQHLLLLEKTDKGLKSKELGAVRFVRMKEP